jgi:hypothetical protein
MLYNFIAAVVDISRILLHDCWYFSVVEMKNWLFVCILQVIGIIFATIVWCDVVVIMLLLLFLFVAGEGSGILMNTAPHGDISLTTW